MKKDIHTCTCDTTEVGMMYKAASALHKEHSTTPLRSLHLLHTVQEVYLHVTTWYLECAMESRLYTADWPGNVTKAAPRLDLYKHAP